MSMKFGLFSVCFVLCVVVGVASGAATFVTNPDSSLLSKRGRVCNSRDQVILYRGNNCQGDRVGSIQTRGFAPGRQCPIEDLQSKSCVVNDEARSLLILPGFSRNSHIFVSNNNRQLDRADYARIILKRELGSNEAVCVTSFEGDINDENVAQDYRRIGGGLDGKVSGGSACS
eukprot:TRINITY_DN518_c0_g4_i1.p1 TRINITY_DN518_c0_g4~~TRINITY_DN518_c0_g4_i1.p1  ORF type:complete len:173 (+),score=29.03 TRINITY_DN518_c0_g4_i1:147-665(+)